MITLIWVDYRIIQYDIMQAMKLCKDKTINGRIIEVQGANKRLCDYLRHYVDAD